MPFAPVPTDDVLDFIDSDATDWDSTTFSEARAAYWAERVGIIVARATGCEEPPDATDEPDLHRLYVTGVAEFIYFLLVRDDDRDELMSPFSSERLGSYSYSKAMSNAQSGTASEGVLPWWDYAIGALQAKCSGSGMSLSTEYVFESPLSEVERDRRILRDPSVWG